MEETEFNTKIVVNFIQQLVTECTYQLHSLVQLLQQLVTGYRPGTGYTALYTCFNNWLQSVPTDRLPAKQPCTATLPCTLTSTTGYSVYRPATGFTALYSSFNWLQCTGRGPATQPYTVVSTAGYQLHNLH